MSPTCTVKSSGYMGIRSQEGVELGRGKLKNKQCQKEKRTSSSSTGKGKKYTTMKNTCPFFIRPSPVPMATHQTIRIVLGHLIDKLIQLQASGANDLDPEMVRMFRSRDVDF